MLDEAKVDGHCNYVQFGRLDIPVDLQRRWDLYRGYAFKYREARQKFLTIPKEKRRIQYVSASRVVVMFPSDATEDEVLDALQFLLNDLKRRWKLDK